MITKLTGLFGMVIGYLFIGALVKGFLSFLDDFTGTPVPAEGKDAFQVIK